MIEWSNLNKDSFMKIEYIGYFVFCIEKIKGLLFSWFGREVELLDISVSEGIKTIPFVDYINRIEDNIRRLSEMGFKPPYMLPCKEWKGEEEDLIRLDYRDVNRWFESLIKMESLLNILNKRIRKTGTYSVGHHYTRHMLRLA